MKRKRMIKIGDNRQWVLDELNFNLDEKNRFIIINNK